MKKIWLTIIILFIFSIVFARGLDSAFERIAELDLPGFAAVYLDDDQQGFVVALVPERVKKPINLIRYYQKPFGSELPLTQQQKQKLWSVILPRLLAETKHPLLTPDARVRFVVARYSYKQLKEWVKLIDKHRYNVSKKNTWQIKPTIPCDSIYGVGFRDVANSIVIYIHCKILDNNLLISVRKDLLAKLQMLGIPKNAVLIKYTIDIPAAFPEYNGGNR